jgi:hypothetical protein
MPNFNCAGAASWRSRGYACAVERATDPLDCSWINTKPSGDLADALRSSGFGKGRSDRFFQIGGYRPSRLPSLLARASPPRTRSWIIARSKGAAYRVALCGGSSARIASTCSRSSSVIGSWDPVSARNSASMSSAVCGAFSSVSSAFFAFDIDAFFPAQIEDRQLAMLACQLLGRSTVLFDDSNV